MGRTKYKQGVGPEGVKLEKGAALVWTSDGSVTEPGFKVCASHYGSLVLVRVLIWIWAWLDRKKY